MGCSSMRSGKTAESAIKKANQPSPAPVNATVSKPPSNLSYPPKPAAEPPAEKPVAEPPAKKPSIKQPPNPPPPEVTPPAKLPTLPKEPPSSEKTVALWLNSLYSSITSKISSNI